MKATKRILLYGNTVILGTIGISLGRHAHFEVTKLSPPLQEIQTVDAGETDIVLFDLETTRPEAVLALLGINPALQLIGISPDSNLIKIWSVREMREVSTMDLLNVFNYESKGLPANSWGDDDRPLKQNKQMTLKKAFNHRHQNLKRRR